MKSPLSTISVSGELGQFAAVVPPSAPVMTLYELDDRNRYQTDKLGRRPNVGHDYGRSYEFHWDRYRSQPIVFWEIGVQRGDSLRMWADYFPSATVIGLDVERPSLPLDPRCRFYQIDATDPVAVTALAAEYPPDIVLDDGSHFAGDMTKTFDLLWGRTRLQYAIEDLGTQYRDRHDGRFVNARPFTTQLRGHCDRLARGEGGNVERVCWEPGIVFLYKR